MIRVTDGGREITAEEIRKLYGTATPAKAPTPTRNVSALSLFNIALDERIRKRAGQQRSRSSDDVRAIRRAVSPSRIGMRPNGISDAATALIKMSQQRPGVMTGDGLGRINKALSLPQQSSNAFNDNVRSDDGARLASDAQDDENTMRPSTNVIGSQAITDASGSKNIAAAVDAIKADMARGAKPYLA